VTKKAAKTRMSGAIVKDGVVLLEVILAIALFMSAAGVLGAALHAGMRAGREIRVASQAEDLAVTKLSEIQMGLLDAADAGPNAYEDDGRLADWTWQIVTTAADNTVITPGLNEKRVEIIIRNAPANYTYRLTTLLPAGEAGI